MDEFRFKEEFKNDESNHEKKISYGYLDLFKYKSIRLSTIGGSVLFFCIYLVYYGTTFVLSGLDGNIYINALVASGAEFISYLLCIPIAMKVPRKITFIASFLLSGVLGFAFIFLAIPEACKKGDCVQKTLQTIFIAVISFV